MSILELGHVVLYVSNLEESTNFYRDLLGFPEIARLPGAALFSGGRTHHEMLLIEIGGVHPPKERGHPEPGLYHIGLKIGHTSEELREMAQKLKVAGVSLIGATDHTITHSLYILDPDQNELELYVDVSDAWKKNPQSILAPPQPLPYLEDLFS